MEILILLKTKQIVFAWLLTQTFHDTTTADNRSEYFTRALQQMNIAAIRTVLETSTTNESLQRKIESLTRNADGLDAAKNPVFINYKTRLEQGLTQPIQDLRSFLANYLQELEQSSQAVQQ